MLKGHFRKKNNMNNKIAVNTYVLTITLNANELNASVKRQNGG